MNYLKTDSKEYRITSYKDFLEALLEVFSGNTTYELEEMFQAYVEDMFQDDIEAIVQDFIENYEPEEYDDVRF
jgi:predicted component of type VI protein secretion system